MRFLFTNRSIKIQRMAENFEFMLPAACFQKTIWALLPHAALSARMDFFIRIVTDKTLIAVESFLNKNFADFCFNTYLFGNFNCSLAISPRNSSKDRSVWWKYPSSLDSKHWNTWTYPLWIIALSVDGFSCMSSIMWMNVQHLTARSEWLR